MFRLTLFLDNLAVFLSPSHFASICLIILRLNLLLLNLQLLSSNFCSIFRSFLVFIAFRFDAVSKLKTRSRSVRYLFPECNSGHRDCSLCIPGDASVHLLFALFLSSSKHF